MTAQVMDNFLYEEEMTIMAEQPLTPYLESQKIVPFSIANSSCRRGYVATWELIGTHLFIIDFCGFTASEARVGMTYLFGNENAVHAVWFSGDIRVLQGELVYYLYHGYESIHEHDVILSFEKGVLIHKYPKNNKNRAKRKEEEDNDFFF